MTIRNPLDDFSAPDRIEVTKVRDLRTPIILIVSSFTVALLLTIMAYLIGYAHGQALACRLPTNVPVAEVAWFGFKGGFDQ